MEGSIGSVFWCFKDPHAGWSFLLQRAAEKGGSLMYEQDYIMRLIKEMIRTLLKLLFNIDSPSPSAELLENDEQRQTLESLLNMIDEGRINEAENRLYDIIETPDGGDLKTALLFYSYLNEKSDEFLEEHDFDRDEVKQGLESIISQCGVSGFTDIFTE